jgi:hypothetical protein
VRCGARELLQEERVAAALLVERVGVRRAGEQLARSVGVQRAERDPGDRAGPAGALQRTRQALGDLVRPRRQREQDRAGQRPPQHRAEQLDRAGVGPMHVVEHEHERCERRERLEQPAHGAVRAVALDLQPRARLPGKRRQDVRELAEHLVAECGRAARVEAADVVVERVDEDPEGQVVLELRRAARQDEPSARIRQRRQLAQQSRLADPRIADDLEHAGLPAPQIGERAVHGVELGGAPDDLLKPLRHLVSWRAYTGDKDLICRWIPA